MESIYDYTFNQNDYECIIRITNGVNDLYLKPEAWDELFLEEDIFDWVMRGSITIKSPYDTFERSSPEAMVLTGADDKKLIYKFRNDGRDTIFISIIPKNTNPNGLFVGEFTDDLWRIEIEGTITNVEDLTHTNISNRMKRLYFIDKTYQMMLEKNIEFTTATVGSNKSKTNIHKLTNEERSLKTGEALGELLLNDEEFMKYADLYVDGDPDYWDMGDDKNKILYTSPTNNRFIDDLNYIFDRHSSSESNQFQPCILKQERAKSKMMPKQFSLIPLKTYFKKAGRDKPGPYQLEHYVLEEISQTGQSSEPLIQKAPITSSASTTNDVKGEDYSRISNYKLVDLSGSDYSSGLQNRFVSSFNTKDGQFNIEINEHKSEKFKDFYKDNVADQVLTTETDDRLPITKYIEQGYNSVYNYSEKQTEEQRITDGRNRLLKYYLFTNLGISFSLRGLSIRQPGRFFGLSKQTKNDQEYDSKLEGQYFITNVVHHFSNSLRNYSTQIVGVKTHTYQEKNKMEQDDVKIIA